MSVVFLNGEFVDEKEAQISINDTGYYFGDGIYEVVLLYNGKLIDKVKKIGNDERTSDIFYTLEMYLIGPHSLNILRKIKKFIESRDNTQICLRMFGKG